MCCMKSGTLCRTVCETWSHWGMCQAAPISLSRPSVSLPFLSAPFIQRKREGQSSRQGSALGEVCVCVWMHCSLEKSQRWGIGGSWSECGWSSEGAGVCWGRGSQESLWQKMASNDNEGHAADHSTATTEGRKCGGGGGHARALSGSVFVNRRLSVVRLSSILSGGPELPG